MPNFHNRGRLPQLFQRHIARPYCQKCANAGALLVRAQGQAGWLRRYIISYLSFQNTLARSNVFPINFHIFISIHPTMLMMESPSMDELMVYCILIQTSFTQSYILPNMIIQISPILPLPSGLPANKAATAFAWLQINIRPLVFSFSAMQYLNDFKKTDQMTISIHDREQKPLNTFKHL